MQVHRRDTAHYRGAFMCTLARRSPGSNRCSREIGLYSAEKVIAFHEFGLLENISENPTLLQREKGPGNWTLEQGYEVFLKITK